MAEGVELRRLSSANISLSELEEHGPLLTSEPFTNDDRRPGLLMRAQAAGVFVQNAYEGVIRDLKIDTQWARNCYHLHRKSYRVLQLIVLLDIVLTFFEKPRWMFRNVNSFNTTLYPRSYVPFLPTAWSLFIEGVLVSLLAADAFLQANYRGLFRDAQTNSLTFGITAIRLRNNKRIVSFCILVLVSFVDLAIAMVTPDSSFRGAPYIRMLFILLFDRKTLSHFQLVARVLPVFANAMCLIGVLVVFFAWFGCILFSKTAEEGIAYFGNFGEAVWELLVLLTVANFPDIMMPAYKSSRLSSIFFIVFLLLGLYFLMNLLLAVVYNQFNEQKRVHMKEFEHARAENLRRAFQALDCERNGWLEPEVIEALVAEINLNFPDLAPSHNTNAAHVFSRLDVGNDGKIDEREFQKLIDVLHLTVESPSHIFLESWFPQIYYHQRYRRLCEIVKSRMFEVLVDVCVFVNAVVVAIQTSRELAGRSVPPPMSVEDDQWDLWQWLQLLFMIIYMFEMIAKISVYGFHGYFQHYKNRFDALVTISSFLGTLYVVSLSPTSSNKTLIRSIIMIRLLRLVRLIVTLPQFKMIGHTFMKILPSTLSLVKVLFCVMYFFCVLGVQLYGGKINTDPSSKYSSAVGVSVYAEYDQWLFNFNDMSAGMVTLFVLLVGSNWQVITAGFVAVSSGWSRLYFGVFYCIGVLICLNLVVASVLDAFLAEATPPAYVLSPKSKVADKREGLASGPTQEMAEDEQMKNRNSVLH